MGCMNWVISTNLIILSNVAEIMKASDRYERVCASDYEPFNFAIGWDVSFCRPPQPSLHKLTN